MIAEWTPLLIENKRTKVENDVAIVVNEEKIEFADKTAIVIDSNDGIVDFFAKLKEPIFLWGPDPWVLGKLFEQLPTRIFVIVLPYAKKKYRKLASILYAKGFPRLFIHNDKIGVLAKIHTPDQVTKEYMGLLTVTPLLDDTIFIGTDVLNLKDDAWGAIRKGSPAHRYVFSSSFEQVEDDDIAIEDD